MLASTKLPLSSNKMRMLLCFLADGCFLPSSLIIKLHTNVSGKTVGGWRGPSMQKSGLVAAEKA